ncbi:hypothetical protein GCM10027168_19830 [Streptomyces capparidis]
MTAAPRRVGMELEFPVVDLATGRGMDRGTAERLWHSFAAHDSSWSVTKEPVTGATVGVRRKNGGYEEQVNTDTGVCTVEVSLAPQETVHAALRAARTVLGGVQQVLTPLGHTLLGAGIQPRTWFDPARKSRKDWYLLLARRWHLHHWFVPVASHQVSVDVSPTEAVRVVNLLSGLAGVFAAFTASSPVARGTLQPWKETRNRVWYERARRVPEAEAAYTSNTMPSAPYPDIGAYLEHFWDSRVYFLTDLKSGGCEVLGGLTFREFLLSDAPVPARDITGRRLLVAPDRGMLDRIHQYGWPAAKLHYGFDARTGVEDVRSALAAGRIGDFFLDHAVRCYVENRSCGVAPQGEEGAAAALTVGLVERLDDAERLLCGVPWAAWGELWTRASTHGLSAERPGLLGVMRELLRIAESGLRARGAGEEGLLAPLFARLEEQRTPADLMIDAFRAGGVRRLLDEFGHRY